MMPVKKSQNWLPSVFNDFFGNEWMEKTNTASPAVNILETDKEYKVEVAAPGLTKEDFQGNVFFFPTGKSERHQYGTVCVR